MNLFIKKIQNIFLNFDKSIFNQDIIEKEITPIFILGLPRSGTTFLYQALLNSFKLAYISNMMYLFPDRMIKILKLSKNRILNFKQIKNANYGFINGLNSPSEAGEILRFWFDNEFEKKKKNVKNTFLLFHQIAETNLIIKNLYNIFRVDKLVELFPKSIFIYIKREPLFIAQSIYLARKKRNEEFFGIKPEGYEKVLNEPVVYQIAWQIKELERLHEDAKSNYKDNFITINYENLEEDLKKLKSFLSKNLDLIEKDESGFHVKSNKALLENSEWVDFKNEFLEYYKKLN